MLFTTWKHLRTPLLALLVLIVTGLCLFSFHGLGGYQYALIDAISGDAFAQSAKGRELSAIDQDRVENANAPTVEALAHVALDETSLYTFTIIAKTGDQNISAFGRDDGTEYVSINDSGHVAFIARVGSDQAIFVGNGNASPRMVTSEDGNPQSGFLYGPGLQLNNENRIIAVDRRIASGGARYHLREWQVDAPGPGQATAWAEGIANPQPYEVPQYLAIFGFSSLSDNGHIVFSALATFGNNRILGAIGPNLDRTFGPNTDLRPVVGDNGVVAVKATTTSDRILLYDYMDQMKLLESVAIVGSDFTEVGHPGISDDGRIVVFYGNLTSAGATKFNTQQANLTYAGGGTLQLQPLTPGEGIFASIATDAGQVLQRVAGLRENGQLDPGEWHKDIDGDGIVDAGEDMAGMVTGFYPDSRPSVSNSGEGKPAIVVFVGDDVVGQKFVMSSPILFSGEPNKPYDQDRPIQILATAAIYLIGEGRSIPGLSTSIQDIGVFDSINNRDEIAFWIKAGSQQAVIRAGRQLLPLILIPGVGGSELRYKGSIGLSVSLWLLGSRRDLSLAPAIAEGKDVYAPDILREIAGKSWLEREETYAELIEFLTEQGGYRADQDIFNLPVPRSNASCPALSAENKPTLFIFPYDWRRGIDENAIKLKEYIDCVRSVYSADKVDILAHSMGGLLARRYILDAFKNVAPDYGHHVNQLITLGSPFLGAPKLLYVLETGDFIPFIASSEELKNAVETMPGAHHLMPSEAYFNVADFPPMEEDGLDFDQDGNSHEVYSYKNLVEAMDLDQNHKAYKPGTTNQQFHSFTRNGTGQDDWRGDKTHVRYTHIVGLRSVVDTPGQIEARDKLVCQPLALDPAGLICRTHNYFYIVKTYGDGTVPYESATKRGNGYDYNAPEAEVIPYFGPFNGGNTLVSHNGLDDNPKVLNKILELLLTPVAEDTVAAQGYAAVDDEEIPAFQPAHYILLLGGQSIIITDASGNSTVPVEDDMLGTVPGASHYTVGDSAQQIALAANGEYSVTFQTTDKPLIVEIDTGFGTTATHVIRYLDVQLPTNATGQLRFTNEEVSTLRYDADGDGNFEGEVMPTANLSGPSAQDIESPRLSVNSSQQGEQSLVVVSAQDTGAGVKAIFYSLDGTEFHLYTQPIQVDHTQHPIFYVFADDNLANRSSLVRHDLTAPQVESLLQLSVNSLSYSAIVGGPNPAAQSITINSSQGEQINWTATTSAEWIKPSALSGTTPATLNLGVDISALAPGIHKGQVTIKSSAASDIPQYVEVSLLVLDMGGSEGVLHVEPSSFTLVANVDGENPPEQSFSISNSGSGTLLWIASTSSQWLRLSSTGGSAPATIGLSIDTTGLTEGTHTAQVTLLSGAQGSPKFLDVTLTLHEPILSSSPADLVFSVQEGEPSPAAKQLTIANKGTGTLTWLASESLPWLSLSSTAGTAPSTIDVSVNLDGVAAGNYTGQITIISSENASLVQTATVQLTVTPQGEPGYQLFMPRMIRP